MPWIDAETELAKVAAFMADTRERGRRGALTRWRKQRATPAQKES